MAKKTLAEQIADLAKPDVHDFDIEDSERGVFEHEDKSEGGHSESEDDDELRNKHYLKVGKSKLRDQSFKLKDPKYTGSKSSRKEIFGGSDSDHEDLEEYSKEDSEEDSEGDQDEDSEEASEEASAEEQNDEEEGVADSDDSAMSLKADSEDEEEDELETEPSTDEEEVSSKRDKLKQMMASERKQIINRLSTSTQTDALKGYAVITQQKLFDSIIDSRIKIQKAVTSANLLPLDNEIYEEYKEDNTDEQLKSVESTLHSILDNIISLRTKIYNKENVTKEPLKFNKSKKRTFDRYSKETEKLDIVLNKYRENVLTKWSHKVQSASGATALNASKFKAINQSAAQQVDVNLLDMERLVKRTRLNRRNVKPLGHQEDEEVDDEAQKVDRSLKEDEHVFDDEDFYRVLLNDLVDKKISDSNPVNGLTIQLTKTKLKKNVDTKASKGRKLKYTIQEQIQNFEAPRGSFKWSDEQIDEFFAGLLGQRVNFDEREQSEAEDQDEDEETHLLKNDDLQIFG